MTLSVHHQTLREELEQLGLWALLDDPENTDVVVNADGTVHVFGYRGVVHRPDPLPRAKLHSCIATMAGIHRRVINADNATLEASLPFHGIRVTAVVPPITTAPVLALRIPPRRRLALDDLVDLGSLTPTARDLLTSAIAAGETCVISGAVNSGKTVLASALLSDFLERGTDERLLVIEDGAMELQLPERSNVTRLLSEDPVERPITRLLRVSLRLNPDRITIGELRGPEALDFVKSALSGHAGLATIHANSPTDAVARLTDLLEEAGSPPSPARVARSVRLIVQVIRHKARRRVQEIVRLTPPDAHGHFDLETLYPARQGD